MRLLLIIVCMLFSTAASADTDYLCLNSCVNKGGKSADCMSQCEYNTAKKPVPAVKSLSGEPNAHNQFKAPVPTSQIITGKKQEAPSTTTDYTCITKCAQQGLQYDYCERSCTKLNTSTLPSH